MFVTIILDLGRTMYEYRCKVNHIVDGDTVDVDIDLGFGVWMHKERIRMYGIDTPESRTRDPEEKKYGLAAKKFLTEMLNDPKGLTLKTSKDATGKYGRILGEIWRTSNYSNQSINQFMIDKHHAVAYFGQSKQDIAEQHLLNRQHVQTELSEFKLTED
jgi:micrococcal nuclease